MPIERHGHKHLGIELHTAVSNVVIFCYLCKLEENLFARRNVVSIPFQGYGDFIQIPIHYKDLNHKGLNQEL